MEEAFDQELSEPNQLFSSLKDVHPKISALWSGGLILVMLFFWRVVGPGSSMFCFCCMPVFFMIILAILGIGNAVNTVRNGIKLVLTWRKYEPLQLNQHYIRISALINILGWVAVEFIPLHFTWEGWYLDQHWNEYKAAVEEANPENLEIEWDTGGYIGTLPNRHKNLSADGRVRADYRQVYFGFHWGQGGIRYGILYCRSSHPCEMEVAIYLNNDTPICWSLRPHWYRCIVTNW